MQVAKFVQVCCLNLTKKLKKQLAWKYSDGWIHTVCVHACAHAYMHVFVYVCVTTEMDGFILCVCMRALMRICMCLCMCVCMTTETDPGCCDGFQ